MRSQIWEITYNVLLVVAVIFTAGCGRSIQDPQAGSDNLSSQPSSSNYNYQLNNIAPPEAIPQHAEYKRGLPPAGWTAGVVWLVAVHDMRTTGTSGLEVDWVRFYCISAGQDILLSGESTTNRTGVEGGGHYTRYPWFGNNDAHTTMNVNFLTDIAVLPLSSIQDKVWHFWGPRVLIPFYASRCYAAARVRPNGNAVVQLGLDFWKDQNVGWCGLDQCNTQGSASDWYGAAQDWIMIYSGK